MIEKKNIIQFLPYFPPHKGGLETHAEEWGKWWVKKGYGEVINLITDFNQEYSLGEEIIFEGKIIGYKRSGVENLIIPSIEIISTFPLYKVWGIEYKRILRYINEKNIDIIITRTRFFLTSLIGGFYARKNKIYWCHIEHGSDYVKLNSKLLSLVAKIYDKIIGKWIFRKSAILFGVSKASKKFIQKNFVNRDVNVVHRGIEFGDIFLSKTGNLHFIFVGRLVTLKGVDDLLRAYKKSNTNIKLVIIGDGPQKIDFEKYSKENNLNVDFFGFKDRGYIIDYLFENKCILVNASYQEGLPSSVVEGLITGNIVIATNVGGTNEISELEDLVLFESGDIDRLTNLLNFSVKNYDNLVGKSREMVINRFSWDKNIEKYYNLLNYGK